MAPVGNSLLKEFFNFDKKNFKNFGLWKAGTMGEKIIGEITHIIGDIPPVKRVGELKNCGKMKGGNDRMREWGNDRTKEPQNEGTKERGNDGTSEQYYLAPIRKPG